jgi:RimJ/RimL family protein N-acetyltransferase
VVGARFRSRGLGSRSVARMIEFLRDGLAVREASVAVDARNEPSLRLARALGFALRDGSDPRNLRLSLRLRD